VLNRILYSLSVALRTRGKCDLFMDSPIWGGFGLKPQASSLKPHRLYIKSGKCPWLSPSFSRSTSMRSSIDNHKLLIGVSLGNAK